MRHQKPIHELTPLIKCLRACLLQCCQHRDFIARFGDFLDSCGDFNTKRSLATNLTTFSAHTGVLEIDMDLQLTSQPLLDEFRKCSTHHHLALLRSQPMNDHHCSPMTTRITTVCPTLFFLKSTSGDITFYE